MKQYDISDYLVKELEENFGPHQVRRVKNTEGFYKIQGYLEVLDWIKDKQVELREAQFSGKETITIDTS